MISKRRILRSTFSQEVCDRRSPHLMSSDIFSHRGSRPLMDAAWLDLCHPAPGLCAARKVATEVTLGISEIRRSPWLAFFTPQNLKKTRKNKWMFTIYKDLFCDVPCPERKSGARSVLNSPWPFFRNFFPMKKGWSSTW